MKRGYYIHFDGRLTSGVDKKISMQVAEFENKYLIEEINIQALQRNLYQRIMGLFPWKSIKRKYEPALSHIEKPDFLYVRRTIADRDYIKFLEIIKKNYPECKIIVEIFTFPYYKDEFLRWNAWPFYFKEINSRHRFKKVIDRFVTHSDKSEIFGVPTIRTINGIKVSKVRSVNTDRPIAGEIVIIAVAFMQKHHGYERVIKGISNYYKKGGAKKIKCLFIGEGPERNKYEKLVEKLQLNGCVVFLDNTVGEELDKLYEKADLALVSFGFYKENVYKVSTIKAKEYLAKGIPMISGCEEQVLVDKKNPFILNVSNNSTSLDFFEIINFYEELLKKYGRKEIITEMRKLAYETVDMPIVMQPIFDYIDFV